MIYSESEKAWIERRAQAIAAERGWSMPISRSEAAAELARHRASGRSADVVDIRRGDRKR